MITVVRHRIIDSQSVDLGSLFESILYKVLYKDSWHMQYHHRWYCAVSC